jgi:hypothetical protein
MERRLLDTEITRFSTGSDEVLVVIRVEYNAVSDVEEEIKAKPVHFNLSKFVALNVR